MALFIAVLGYRLILCWQAPLETSDLLRNLGYSAHLSSHGFSIYGTRAAEFAPEPWTTSWSHQGYI